MDSEGPDSSVPSCQKRCRSLKDEAFHSVWKKVRHSEECKYDFTKATLLDPSKRKSHLIRKGADLPQSKDSKQKRADLKPESLMSTDASKDLDLGLGSLDDMQDLPLDDQMKAESRNVQAKEAPSIDSLNAYVHDLKQHDAVAPCDQMLRTFVVQDFSCTTCSLKPRSFVFVSRSARYFAEDLEWILWCSCDQPRGSLVSSTGLHIEMKYSTFQDRFKPCLHVSAMKIVLSYVDALHDVTPSDEFADHTYSLRLVEVMSSEDDSGVSPEHLRAPRLVSLCHGQAICLTVDDKAGVVCLCAGKVVCATCKYGHTSCSHIQSLVSMQDKDIEKGPILSQFLDTLQMPHSDKTKTYSCLSVSKIPFKPTVVQQSVMKESPFVRFSIEDGSCTMVPAERDTCPKCRLSGTYTTVTHERDAIVITLTEVIPAKVYKRSCQTVDCSEEIHFNGESKCLLDMKTLLVAYEVFQSFMLRFLLGRITMYTEHTVLKEFQCHLGNDLSSVFTYNHFRISWYNYLSLLDIDYASGFQCVQCGDQPTTVVMDATSLAFRKELDSWNRFLQTPDLDSCRKAGRYCDRILINHKRTRTLLTAFTQRNLTIPEATELTDLICKNAPSLTKLLLHLIPNDTCKSITCPPVWKKFVHCLAASSPVCALVHPCDIQLHELLLSIAHREKEIIALSATSLHCLQECFPVLFNLIHSLKSSSHEYHALQSMLSPVLLEMLFKMNEPFKTSATESCDEDKYTIAANADDITFFPHLPVVRNRGAYIADRNSAKKVCTKLRAGHPTLLPGIFTLFCEHGICYGFEVMRTSESPNTPFTILFTRFKQAPSVIIYDNSCNLHNYSLNREPVFFKNSRFLVDRFHWQNHVGCSEGYKMSSYPQFARINSQVVEQSNAILKRTKSSLSYMNKENFINHCKLLLWYHNSKKHS